MTPNFCILLALVGLLLILAGWALWSGLIVGLGVALIVGAVVSIRGPKDHT